MVEAKSVEANRLTALLAQRSIYRNASPAHLARRAVQNNPVIKVKTAEISAATSAVQSAEWQFFPTPTIRAERFEERTVSIVGVRQPIWTGGRLSADVNVAERQKAVAEKALAEAKHDLAIKVANAWLESLSAKDRQDVALVGMEELRDLEHMMQRRVATGYSAPVELSLVRSRLLQMQSDSDRAKLDMEAGLSTLTSLLGGRPQMSELLAVSDPPSLEVSDAWAQRIASTHPTMSRLQAAIDLSRAKVDQAKAQVMPTVVARAEYQDGEYPGSMKSGSRFYVNLEQTIGAGLSAQTNVASARAAVMAAQEQRDLALREIAAELEADYLRRESAVARTQVLESITAEMGNLSQSYRRAFNGGRRSWLELLNVVRERTDSAQQLLRSRLEIAYFGFKLATLQGLNP